ncbi:MAG: translation elongation factor Ts [Defluviitaleaceae bacterium]|nr:translation elongation factor Ts [Defluviitaleaceae bacterium]
MVTPAMIRELREISGAGMTDCKRALEETNGDLKEAVAYLREKGLAAAAKKAGRIAAEGLVALKVSGDDAFIVEVNCETDFAAKADNFKSFVADVVDQIEGSKANDMDAFMAEPWGKGEYDSVADALKGKIATIGENLNIRRFERIKKQKPGVISSYVHGGGAAGVLLEIHTDSADPKVAEMGNNLCMQIVAMAPRFLNVSEVDQDYLESERKILLAQAQNENPDKPEQVIEKMVEGRINKQLKEICLVEQAYVKDGSMSVKAYVESVSKEVGAPITLVKFVAYEKGEGIEKKEDNFAEEVAKAAGGGN